MTDERIKKPVVEEKTVKMKVASDTIFLYVEADVHNALAGLIAYCDYLQVRLLRQNNPVLSRGAIAKGEVYTDGDVCFGPAIVEAYLMEEELVRLQTEKEACELVGISVETYKMAKAVIESGKELELA